MRALGDSYSDNAKCSFGRGIRRWREWSFSSCIAISCYLLAACAANTLVTIFGPLALPFTGFFLIPFDLTARDYLHERWQGNWLFMRMAALVLSGSLLAWLFGGGSREVCIASGASFLLSGAADSIVYFLLKYRSIWVKMNASNLASSVVDSIAFPLIAFGGISLGIMSSQVILKVAGGLLWVWLFIYVRGRRTCT